MSNNIAIKVDNVGKTFKLPHEKNSSIKQAVVGFARRKKSYEQQHALDGVSFEVKAGEFFGIVGRNGSGKSTLLKILSGIYQPTEGHVTINGKLTPFIELGVGFNPELTGRENVFLNGALLGYSRKEMQKMYDEIVEFAELHKFMDQKLKNYSSGMQVRLAFSIAIRAQSDILVLDEVLAVGDTNFQKKCFDVFADFKRQKRTVVLVTHDMSSVEKYCDRAMLINEGKLLLAGDVDKVIKKYNAINTEAAIAASKTVSPARISNENKAAQITTCSMGSKGAQKYVFRPSDKISVKLEVDINDSITGLMAGIIVYDQLSRPLFATNTKAKKTPIGDCKKGDKIVVEFVLDNILSDGTYYVTPSVVSQGGRLVHDTLEEPLQFKTDGWSYPAYLLQPKHSIKISKESI